MRTRLILALLLASATALASCGEHTAAPTAPDPDPTPAPAPALPPSTPPSADAEVTAFVSLVNAHRQSLGLAPLVWDSTAAAVAYAHSEDMATQGYFSHTSLDGETPFDRMRAAGMTYTYAGENIAFGFATASLVYDAWMASPGHRANIEKAEYTHHGVGRYGTYWTHVFFTPPSP